MSDDEVLYFLTIPKTASTTLYHILARYFPPDRVAPVQPLRGLIATPIGDIWRYQLVGGHYFYNVLPVLGRTPIIITMLRDPLERALSYYAHIQRNPNHYAYHRVGSQSIETFVDDERNLPLFSNVQVRYLGQTSDIPNTYLSFSRSETAQGKFMEALEAYAPNGFDDPAMYTLAQARIDEHQIAFVGIKERFDESVRRLCSLFDWEVPQQYERMMVAPNPVRITDIPPSVELKIRNANVLDYRLYNEALRHFDAVSEQYAR